MKDHIQTDVAALPHQNELHLRPNPGSNPVTSQTKATAAGRGHSLEKIKAIAALVLGVPTIIPSPRDGWMC